MEGRHRAKNPGRRIRIQKIFEAKNRNEKTSAKSKDYPYNIGNGMLCACFLFGIQDESADYDRFIFR